MEQSRIVITGLGLTSPNGNTIEEYRKNLLDGVAGVQLIDVRYMGQQPAGVCDFDTKKYQNRKELRVGTRAGSIAIYCAHEAVTSSGIDFDGLDKSSCFIQKSLNVIPIFLPHIIWKCIHWHISVFKVIVEVVVFIDSIKKIRIVPNAKLVLHSVFFLDEDSLSPI